MRPEVQKARDEAYLAELDDWKQAHGDDPVAVTMHVSDAKSAMAASDRFTLAVEDMAMVYDLGAPSLMPKAAADALVAQDKIRYRAEPVPAPKDDAPKTSDAPKKEPAAHAGKNY